MDLNGSCSHLQGCLIEESDELSREENNHLLSQELCRVKGGEREGERYTEKPKSKIIKQAQVVPLN